MVIAILPSLTLAQKIASFGSSEFRQNLLTVHRITAVQNRKAIAIFRAMGMFDYRVLVVWHQVQIPKATASSMATLGQ